MFATTWFNDESDLLKSTLKAHGHDHDEFCDCIDERLGYTEGFFVTRVNVMNAWLANNGDGKLRVSHVRNAEENLDWRFLEDNES